MVDSETSLDPKLEHLSALHSECLARAKVVSDRSGVRISDEIVSLVTESAFRFVQLLATDMESFARHAKRSTINQDDVFLFTRRNPQLRKFLDEKSSTFDVAAGVEDENVELQPVKRRMRQSVKSAKKPLGTVATPSPSMTSVKNFPIPAGNALSAANVSRVATSPLKRALLKGALSPTKAPSSSKTAEAMEILPQKTSERKDSPVPTVFTPTVDDRQQPGVEPLRVSLLDSGDEFSNIFDDFGDV